MIGLKFERQLKETNVDFPEKKSVLPFAQELIQTMNNDSPQTTEESPISASPITDWSDSISTNGSIELMDNTTPIFVPFLEFNHIEDLEEISQCFMDEKVESSDQLEFIKSLIYLRHYDLATKCSIGSLNDNLAKYSVCKYLMENGEYVRSAQILKTMKDPYLFYGQKELLNYEQVELVDKEFGLLIKSDRTDDSKAPLIKSGEAIVGRNPEKFAQQIKEAASKRKRRIDRSLIEKLQQVPKVPVKADDSWITRPVKTESSSF